MHRSRINGILIDCNVGNIGEAARFWAEALGRPVDPDHPGTRGDYVMLETPPGEISVQLQRVDHESRVHIDIETDDIPAEAERPALLHCEGPARGLRQGLKDVELAGRMEMKLGIVAIALVLVGAAPARK